jgi:hypothetical protein
MIVILDFQTPFMCPFPVSRIPVLCVFLVDFDGWLSMHVTRVKNRKSNVSRMRWDELSAADQSACSCCRLSAYALTQLATDPMAVSRPTLLINRILSFREQSPLLVITDDVFQSGRPVVRLLEDAAKKAYAAICDSLS